jgi:mannose-1-phosphate guanylyltransferase
MPLNKSQTRVRLNNIENINANLFSNRRNRDLWGIVLAGGDGKRLSSLTRRISGDERPKQFCPLVGSEPILTQTKKRLSLTIDDEQTVYVLNQKHERYFQPLLPDVPAERKVIQPENKGTAVAILYSLLRVSIFSHDATVAIFPSDHFVADEKAFMNYIKTAHHEVESKPDSVIILGIEPDKPETEYGWIEGKFSPKKQISQINRFWEKPTPNKAQELFKAGCLWNSFVMVGKISTFLRLIAKTMPEFYANLVKIKYTMNTMVERAVIHDLFQNHPQVDFSRDILEVHPTELKVLKVQNVGWNDLGQPNRVLHTLNHLGFTPQWANYAS